MTTVYSKEFLNNMRRDPIRTIESLGVKLTAEQKQAFQKADWHNLSDEELDGRITKKMIKFVFAPPGGGAKL